MKLFTTAQEATEARGWKDIFHNGQFIAVGDKEDLPKSKTEWVELSMRELIELTQNKEVNDYARKI